MVFRLTLTAAVQLESAQPLSGALQITASDYLDHDKLFGVLSDFLRTKKAPLRFLDLGCGDAGNIVKVLGSSAELVASYTGKYLLVEALVEWHDRLLPSMKKAIGQV